MGFCLMAEKLCSGVRVVLRGCCFCGGGGGGGGSVYSRKRKNVSFRQLAGGPGSGKTHRLLS